ncbi:hypothetical protein FE257_003910 [Aspergillus nanangensis]|uniref:Dimethylallyl tryptophan synthase n=1 Tax=Aspergillus nanangensis TaxID=2582783 RepID=A0AAD4CRM5_ASPNN|nr:hypothetical protein FE257_003910 [Aspergillus nanangensis]
MLEASESFGINAPQQTESLKSVSSSSSGLPYHYLSKYIYFQNIDHHDHWHDVAPMLGKMLVDGRYSVHQQYQYLSFFAHHIIPMLGPAPELSQNFHKSGCTTRIAFEPTSYLATTKDDRLNRMMLNEALSRLKIIGVDLNLQLYHELVNELTLTDEDESAICERNDLANNPITTQTVLALDFNKTGIAVKLYLYPTLKATITGRSVSILAFDAIRKIDKDDQFTSPLAILESYFRNEKIDACFLSCDLVNPQHTRFKLYLFEYDVRFSRIADHWTLAGRLSDKDTLTGLEMLYELWEGFGIPDGKRKPTERPTRPGDPPTLLPLIFNYEMKPGHSIPKPKFYFPLTGIVDMKIARTLTAFFERHNMPDQANGYIENLMSYYPGKDLNIETDYQAWLSFSYSKSTGPYMTVYYH